MMDEGLFLHLCRAKARHSVAEEVPCSERGVYSIAAD
jgi:hypothetical protein